MPCERKKSPITATSVFKCPTYSHQSVNSRLKSHTHPSTPSDYVQLHNDIPLPAQIVVKCSWIHYIKSPCTLLSLSARCFLWVFSHKTAGNLGRVRRLSAVAPSHMQHTAGNSPLQTCFLCWKHSVWFRYGCCLGRTCRRWDTWRPLLPVNLSDNCYSFLTWAQLVSTDFAVGVGRVTTESDICFRMQLWWAMSRKLTGRMSFFEKILPQFLL